MALLITPTLLNSFDWYNGSPEDWKQKAFTDLSNQLKRTGFNPSRIMEVGIEVEKAVAKFIRTKEYPDNLSKEMLDLCKRTYGYDYQVKRKRIIRIDDIEYLLYGKLDFYSHANKHIIDMKVTQEYKGQDYFLKQNQHLLYCYSCSVNHFTYLVAEIPDPDNPKIREVIPVEYQITDAEELKNEITERIQKFRSFLRENEELKEAYLHTFNMYNN